VIDKCELDMIVLSVFNFLCLKKDSILIKRIGVVIMFFIVSSIFVHGQNIRSKSDMFLLRFVQESKVLEANYKENLLILNRLSLAIEPTLSDLKNGLAHLELSGYITKQNSEAINNVSIQASVVRAYLKIKYGLNNDCFTFNIDNSFNTENTIGIAVKYLPVPEGANRNIYYTFNPMIASLNLILSQYGSIPYKQNNSTQLVENIEILPCKKSREVAYTLNALKHNLKDASVISMIDKRYIVSINRPKDVANTADNLNNKFIRATINHPGFAIKTNLIYWSGFTPSLERGRVSTIPNIELEYYINRRFSLSMDAIYTPLIRNKTGNDWRYIDGLAIEPRIWLINARNLKNNFRGIYTGIYAITGEFDFMHPSLGFYGYTGSYYGAGISIGIVFPLVKDFALEIGSRGGFRIDNWESYEAEDGSYYYIDSGSQRGFQLQGLRLSIMYRFGGKL